MVAGVRLHEQAAPAQGVGEEDAIPLGAALDAELDEGAGGDPDAREDLLDDPVLPVLGEDTQLAGRERPPRPGPRVGGVARVQRGEGLVDDPRVGDRALPASDWSAVARMLA
jgi:hypothetical protein